MDPTRYWMLTRRKFGEQKTPLFATPNITAGNGGSGSASYYESWEERAFAEDSAGHLGGCIWPPRSYSCSFCGREFRSAQALGGHMNVHRRDRARLKLAGVPDDGGSDSQIVSPRQSYMIQPCPPQVASLQHAYIANPNASSTDTNPDPLCSVLAHPPPGSLVQASTARNVWGNQVLSAPLASLSAWVTSGKKEMIGDAAQSALNHPRPVARMCYNQELHVGSGEYNKLSILGCRTRRDFREGSNHEDSVPVGGKRRRIDMETSPLILCSYSRKHQQDGEGRGQDNPNNPKVLKLCPSSQVEELDLELRLGEAPKVK
ncbi:hypothetical protein QOZ80_5BG0448770 [Eleusine coracana subsp. coracana]|nr:hypothetical protein QOZ80_5BG0448770 [Eleusine coracana subsp. coracana]